jgi:hypothetical protein
MNLGLLQNIDGMRRHPLRLLVREALGRDEPQVGDAHGLHRARGGADVAGVARAAQHDTDVLQGL